MGPLLRVPHHPLTLARFGAPTVLPASALARWFRTTEARALFGGVAAHAFRPLHYPMTSAIGLGILTAGHRHGWAVAAGGSQSITNALAALLEDLGGKIETGTRIETASQLAAGRRDHVRPGARGGRRHPRRSSAAPHRPAPTGGSAAARARSRSTSPSKAACRGPIPKPAAPAPCMSSARSPNWPPPNATSTPGACRSGPSSWSVSSIWPTRSDRSAMSTRCGPTRMSPTATPATPPRRSSPRSSGSPPASATASSGTPCAQRRKWPPTTPISSAATS